MSDERDRRLRCAEIATDYCKQVVQTLGLSHAEAHPLLVANALAQWVESGQMPKPEAPRPAAPEKPNRATRRAKASKR